MAIEQAIHGSIRFDRKDQLLIPDIPMKTFRRKLKAITDAIDWRVRSKIGDEAIDNRIILTGLRYRQFLEKTTFFGIAGSVGKTTAKDLLTSVLNVRGRTIGNPMSLNAAPEIAKVVLRTRPWHKFCVAELGETAPGSLDKQLAVLQPSIGIITVVGDDHLAAFGSQQAIALEFAKLVQAIPAHGTVVLNLDDELVAALSKDAECRIITYGLSPNAELRAEEISSVWPERLQMTLVQGSERVRLRTQLCGTHWIPSVLGAIGGGLAAGMTLAECAKGIANVAPFDGRMQPVSTPDGVTFIRDDWKGTLWTVDASFAFMQEAQATRKIIVIGTLADCGSGVPQKLERVARWAQEIADHTVFVGHWASNVLKTRKPWEDKLRAFSHVRDATQYVNSITREGDLVLLKGTSKQDHLQRIILARHGDVACWRDDCNRYSFCSECPDLHKPSGAPQLLHRQPPHGATHQLSPSARQILQSDCFVIVGLGNPEVRYANTPHNLGYEVVEKLAESMGLIWKTTPEAWLALGSFMERAVCLIKVKTPMNGTGAGLKQLAESMAFFPAQCVLVYDDLNLPLGIVKMRLSGGAGGHRGVASILEAFQTDAFRRVKVGAGKAGERLDFVNFVLTAFDDETRAVVDRTILTAETRVLDFMNLPTKRNQGEHAPNDRPETLYD